MRVWQLDNGGKATRQPLGDTLTDPWGNQLGYWEDREPDSSA
jgi:hypothetical protein